MATKLSKYELEFVEMMRKMNTKMETLTDGGMMNEEAYRQMGEIQVKQYKEMKDLFRQMSDLFKSDYYRKRTGYKENSLGTKRMTEMEKRKDAIVHPEKYHCCARCDRIFLTRNSLLRHRHTALLCGVIKQTKKGALSVNSHKSSEINNFIVDHLWDDESAEEEQGEDD
jgi:hypothetical protein